MFVRIDVVAAAVAVLVAGHVDTARLPLEERLGGGWLSSIDELIERRTLTLVNCEAQYNSGPHGKDYQKTDVDGRPARRKQLLPSNASSINHIHRPQLLKRLASLTCNEFNKCNGVKARRRHR